MDALLKSGVSVKELGKPTLLPSAHCGGRARDVELKITKTQWQYTGGLDTLIFSLLL